MTHHRAWHPLPILIAAVSVMMCGAAAYAGLHGVGKTLSPPKPLAERHASGLMIGVAGLSAIKWDDQTGVDASLAVFYLSVGLTKLTPSPLPWIEREANSAEPVIDILPGKIGLASIAAGAHDRWLSTLRAEINEKVVVAFAPEANGNWYPWSQEPIQFRAAWRHVWDVLHGPDITWMWQMSSSRVTRGPHSYDDIADYWPGSRYVNWIGIDGYFRFRGTTFGEIFNPTLREARHLPGASGKRILLSETGVGPRTHAVVADLQALLAGAEADHLLGVVYFDKNQGGSKYHQDWYIEPGSAAMAAFQDAALSYEKGST